MAAFFVGAYENGKGGGVLTGVFALPAVRLCSFFSNRNGITRIRINFAI